jgi:hypothetical protein
MSFRETGKRRTQMKSRMVFATFIIGLLLSAAIEPREARAATARGSVHPQPTTEAGPTKRKKKSRVKKAAQTVDKDAKATGEDVAKGGEKVGEVVADGSETAAKKTAVGAKDAGKGAAKVARKTGKATTSAVKKVGRAF